MPSYYAIVPASVRYDKNLIPSAKLLYGEITALCSEKGFCWANNSYFADLYDVSARSISTWINSLVDNGYIQTEIKYRQGTKEVESRKISIVPMEENFRPYGRKTTPPMEENFQDSITVNTTINNKGVDLLFKSEKFKYTWDEWIKFRKERKVAKYTETGLKRTFKDLSGMCGGDEDVAIKIIEQSISKNWQGLFALKQQYGNPAAGNKYENDRQNQLAAFKPVME